MNGTSFLAYVEQILARTLRRGDIVIMDNVSVHKVAGVREVIEVRVATLRYLPPYSPDLNPIEKFLAAQGGHDPWGSLWAVIGSCLADVPAPECAAYLTSAGYDQPIVKCSRSSKAPVASTARSAFGFMCAPRRNQSA